MSRSPTTIDPDRLRNSRAGELLASEFMEPMALGPDVLAETIEVSPDLLGHVIGGRRAIDAELDLRLTRYFGLSEGFFLRLENQYELLEAKRALNGRLDRIVPRAA